MTEIWTSQGKVIVVYLYNPCVRLEEHCLKDIMEKFKSPVIWVGDFNEHNALLGYNGQIHDGK